MWPYSVLRSLSSGTTHTKNWDQIVSAKPKLGSGKFQLIVNKIGP